VTVFVVSHQHPDKVTVFVVSHQVWQQGIDLFSKTTVLLNRGESIVGYLVSGEFVFIVYYV